VDLRHAADGDLLDQSIRSELPLAHPGHHVTSSETQTTDAGQDACSRTRKAAPLSAAAPSCRLSA
jgi:hypothetical protein